MKTIDVDTLDFLIQGKEWEGLPQVEDLMKDLPEVSELVLWASSDSDPPPPPLLPPVRQPSPELQYNSDRITPEGNNPFQLFEERVLDDILDLMSTEALEPVPPVIKKRKREEENKEAYIKKPPNAFMLFIKSERKSLQEELGIKNAAIINKALSERWKTLPAEKREIFEAEATVEAYIHLLKNPGWSNKVNYGKKSKKNRKAPSLLPPSC